MQTLVVLINPPTTHPREFVLGHRYLFAFILAVRKLDVMLLASHVSVLRASSIYAHTPNILLVLEYVNDSYLLLGTSIRKGKWVGSMLGKKEMTRVVSHSLLYRTASCILLFPAYTYLHSMRAETKYAQAIPRHLPHHLLTCHLI